MIYLNCAATSRQRPACVGEAVMRAMGACGSYGRGAGGADLDAARMVFSTREKLARLLGFAHPGRVCFTSGATAALNTAIRGLPRIHGRVIATVWDHNAVLRPLARLADERGMRVDLVPADGRGRIDREALASLLGEPADFLVCTHASNVTGMVCDAAGIIALAHGKGVPVVLDAAQTAGCLPFSMEGLGADVVCVTGHKALMGPTGTGAILVAPGIDLAPLVEGGTGVRSAEPRQPSIWPERLEAGTLNIHGIAGLGAALEWLAETGVERIHVREQALLERFLAGTDGIEGLERYGSFEGTHAAIVSLNLRGRDAYELADMLGGDYGIATRAGLHCAPRMHGALGTQTCGAVRFSFGWFTSEDDIDAACAALREIAGP